MSFLDFLREKDIIHNDLYEIISEKTGDIETYVYDLLISIGDLSEKDIAKLKAEYFGLNYTDLNTFLKIDNIDYSNLEKSLVIPFEISNGVAHIAIDDPNNIESKDKINYYLSLKDDTKSIVTKYYIAKKSDIEHKFREINQSEISQVDRMIFEGIKANASDIHITPFDKTLLIMFRIDGILETYKTIDIEEFGQISISLKVKAKLDISETRRPQSGHFQTHNIDFRISTHPTEYGENIVIRILNKDKSLISIDNLGFSKEQIDHLKTISNFSNGMIIFCGPTGSGKTTSIYSLLKTMNKIERNIMTLEDPVEYKISNVRQTEIKPGVLHFADGIRSILRQDPDVILIGEIRDEETAKMAIRASMTGHLVLTTIHANDSFGAISRLKEFSISPSNIADNIISIISQRLVKKSKEQGRTVICEILKMDNILNGMICKELDKYTMKDYAISKLGFKTISDDCNEKLKNGLISQNNIKDIFGIFED